MCVFVYLCVSCEGGLFQWSQHQVQASRQALQHTLVVNQLADMEWKFGGNYGRLP